MKNLIIPIVFFLFFTVSAFVIDSGGTVVTVVGKKAEPRISFSIPDGYVKKNGELTMPLEYTIVQNGKTVISVLSLELETTIPEVRFHDSAVLILKIGAFSSSQAIKF